jgi:hypothetical protein
MTHNPNNNWNFGNDKCTESHGEVRAGSSVTPGNQTTLTDRNGRFDGRAIRYSDGTTSFYDKSGHFTGSVTNTTPRR